MRNRLMTILKYSVLLVVALGLFAGLTYLAGTLGVFTGSRGTRFLAAQPTNPPPLPGTPVARFERLNPAVEESLDQFRPGYRPPAVDAFGVDVQPLGAYLPRSGNVQFELGDPTPLPTLFPYPTSPPLPAPGVPGGFLPTLVPDDGRTIPYFPGEDDCAPAGNPVEGVLTQNYHRFHLGIDIGVPSGTPVIATHSGQVTYADWSAIGYGYLVILQSGAFITYYAHNTSFNVTEGQFIGKGSVLAWSGSTGNSSGPHVHYETRVNDQPVNPLTFSTRGYGTC